MLPIKSNYKKFISKVYLNKYTDLYCSSCEDLFPAYLTIDIYENFGHLFQDINEYKPISNRFLIGKNNSLYPSNHETIKKAKVFKNYDFGHQVKNFFKFDFQDLLNEAPNISISEKIIVRTIDEPTALMNYYEIRNKFIRNIKERIFCPSNNSLLLIDEFLPEKPGEVTYSEIFNEKRWNKIIYTKKKKILWDIFTFICKGNIVH